MNSSTIPKLSSSNVDRTAVAEEVALPMTAIAERIQKRLQGLPAERAARLERLLEALLEFTEADLPESEASDVS